MTTTAWSYEGRRVVVTGAASGIGAAVADELIGLGADVTGIDLRPRPDGGPTVIADLGDPGDVAAAAASVLAGGRVDVLVNCAGITGTSPVERVMRVNVLGLRSLTDLVTARMEAGGAVVGIGSIGGAGWRSNLPSVLDLLDQPTWADALDWCTRHPEQFPRGAYAFSKQCVIVDAMRRCVDLARRGIRINTVSPGVTDTPMIADSAAIGGPAAVAAVPKPLGRIADAAEPARAVAFLGSDAASYVNGVDLVVDGGMLAGVAVGTIPSA